MNARTAARTSKTARKASGSKEKISTRSLLDSSLRQIRTAPQQAIALARQAYDQAAADGDEELIATSLFQLGIGHRFLGRNQEAISFLSEARSIAERLNDRSLLARILTEIGWVYVRTESIRALEAFKHALAYADDSSSAEWRKLQSSIATAYRLTGAYERALPIYLDLIEHYTASGEAARLAVAYDNLGCVYGELREYETSIRNFLRSIEHARRAGYAYGEATALSNLGEAYVSHGELERAMETLRAAFDIYQRLQEPDGITRTLRSIGELHERRGELSLALKHVRLALRTACAHDNVVNAGHAHWHLGHILLHLGKPEQAIRSLHRALTASRASGDVKLEYAAHELLSEAYETAGDFRSALAHHRSYTGLKDSVIDEQTRTRIAELQMHHDLDRSEREKEIYRLRSEQLEQELRLKRSELTAMALRLVERRADTSGHDPSAATHMHGEHTYRPSDDGAPRPAHDEWDLFEEQFRLVHPDFVRRLSESYPSLSPAELKICALLKIDLASKEISRLLSVSLRSVENHRYRIRRKLSLDPATNLVTFLAPM